jgi:hypothetical protein
MIRKSSADFSLATNAKRLRGADPVESKVIAATIAAAPIENAPIEGHAASVNRVAVLAPNRF